MSNVVTAAFTALFGVIVFVIGQFVQKFILEPIQDQRKTIGQITFACTFYANISHASLPSVAPLYDPEEVLEAKKTLRKLASDLRVSLKAIPLYNFWAKLGVIPARETVTIASANLIGWSNSLSGDSYEKRKAVEDAFGLGN